MTRLFNIFYRKYLEQGILCITESEPAIFEKFSCKDRRQSKLLVNYKQEIISFLLYKQLFHLNFIEV